MVGRPAVAASSQWLVGMRKRYCNSARHIKQVNLRSYDIQVEDVREATKLLRENLCDDRTVTSRRPWA